LIVLDSSPLVAVMLREVDADHYKDAVRQADRLYITAPNKLEVMMVVGGKMGQNGIALVQELIGNLQIETVPFTEVLADRAADAFLRYGKGQNHPAKLNFGDCIAYALAKSLDAPLLYKGDDFAKTDIRSAL
jgi:ribonuclease VapC